MVAIAIRFSCGANLSKSYEECVRQHLSRTNKEEIRTTFAKILELVESQEKVTVSAQVKALYLQTIISCVNENDPIWGYNSGQIERKIDVTKRMLLDVPKVLSAIHEGSQSNYVTASQFLHYVSHNLNLWCPFVKPPVNGGTEADSGRGATVTILNKRRSDP
tara:strand:+ start:111 stop:596 length:486 start_codon:yes stop_codon:yes gene_type:complete